MGLLACLAGQPGRVYSREEILDAVWGDVVVGEEALTRAVSELRRALKDDPRAPRYVETIRKGGYRLVAAVEPAADRGASRKEAGGTLPASPPGPTGGGATPRTGRRGSMFWWPAIAILIIGALAVLFRAWGPGGGETGGAPAQLAPPSATPLTSYPGEERFPAISPGGGHVAFAWSEPGSDNVDVYVTQVGSGSRLRLTDHPGTDTYPRWSAEGDTVAYLHVDEEGQALYTVPIIGGPPRELRRAGAWFGGHAYAPDGKSLVYAEAVQPGRPAALFVADLETGESRPLTPPPGHGTGDVAPAVSPDGRTVAFVRFDSAGLQDVYTVPVSGGEARRLSRGLLQVRGVDWMPDGQSLIVSAVSSATYSLWRMDVGTGDISRVPTRGEWVHYPSTAREADRLVYQDIRFEKNVWRVRRSENPELGMSTEPLITSTRWDCEATYSPDGRRLAFTSARSGSLEVWTSAADGSRPLRLTLFERLNVDNPRWSPDGQWIAFHASDEGPPDLYVIGSDGGRPERLTRGGEGHLMSSWSRDGEWLYFGSDRSGSWELWKLRVDDPPGSVRQVTRGGGISGMESADGRLLYYARPDEAGLWRMSLNGGELPGESRKILEDLPRQGDWGNWSLAEGGVALARREEEGPLIVFYDFSEEHLVPIARVPNIAVPSLAVSPDGRSFLYSRVEQRVSDLMLLENYR